MGCARSQRREQQMPAPPSHNSKQSLDGPEDVWHRSTRAPLIGVGWQSKACTFLRTMSELLFPHLKARCGRQMKKANNFNAEKRVCRGSDKWNNIPIPMRYAPSPTRLGALRPKSDFGRSPPPGSRSVPAQARPPNACAYTASAAGMACALCGSSYTSLKTTPL